MQNREIITLQFGKHANHVATHFWNILDTQLTRDKELRLYHFFREGETLDEQMTFNPRAVIFDEKKEWGSLRRSGFQYVDDEDDGHNAADRIEIIREEEFGMSKFTRTLLASDPSTLRYVQREAFSSHTSSEQEEEDDEEDRSSSKQKKIINEVKKYTREDIVGELDEKARVWTDYLVPHLHPKSVVKIADYSEDPANQVFSVDDMINAHLEESLDQFRYFLEESDSIAGIQLFSNAGDWWSSMTSRILPQIIDEFGKIPIFSTLVQPYIQDEALEGFDLTKSLAYSALGLVDTYHHSSYVLPLNANQFHSWDTKYLHMGDRANEFKWAGVLGMAWETMSQGFVDGGFSNWISTLVPRSSLRIGSLDARMPLGLSVDGNLHDFLISAGPLHERSSSTLRLSPYDERNREVYTPYSQSVIFRGLDSRIPLYESSGDAPKKLSVQEAFLQHVLGKYASQSTQQEYASKHVPKKNTALSDCSTLDEMIDRYVDQTQTYHSSYRVVEKPAIVPYAFPKIFDMEQLNSEGFILAREDTSSKSSQINSLPMMTQLKTGRDSFDYLSQLCTYFKQVGKNGINIPGYQLTKDEVAEKVEELYRLVDDYDD